MLPFNDPVSLLLLVFVDWTENAYRFRIIYKRTLNSNPQYPAMNSEQKSRLLEELFEHATEAIITINKGGEITLVNPAAEKLFAYTMAELEGKKIEFLMPERYNHRHQQHREQFNQHPHSRAMGIGMDLYAKKKNGTEFPVEISISPFESDGEVFTMAFIVDITTRKQRELDIIRHQHKLEQISQELKASNEKLEAKVSDRTKVLQEALSEIEKSRAVLIEALDKEKELNELKSRFLAMASHEFRTPLTTILSSASLIPEYSLTEQQNKRIRHVDRIKSAVNNLNDILSDFLSLSKIEEGRITADMKQFDLRQLVDDIVSEMSDHCKPGQQIQYMHSGNTTVFLDPKLTRNVLINLLSNAIKFSPDHTTIALQTTTDTDKVVMIIHDKGIGISAEDQQHLFERFFRGQNATHIQGTGLGLNIVAKYIELMHGMIEMQSVLDQGTRFTITFPNQQMPK